MNNLEMNFVNEKNREERKSKCFQKNTKKRINDQYEILIAH